MEGPLFHQFMLIWFILNSFTFYVPVYNKTHSRDAKQEMKHSWLRLEAITAKAGIHGVLSAYLKVLAWKKSQRGWVVAYPLVESDVMWGDESFSASAWKKIPAGLGHLSLSGKWRVGMKTWWKIGNPKGNSKRNRGTSSCFWPEWNERWLIGAGALAPASGPSDTKDGW